MQLTTKELFEVTSILLKVVEQHGYSHISFSPDDLYYQVIQHEDRDFGGNPPIAIGSLDDDMERLKHLLEGEYPIPADLERLGAVFTVLGSLLSSQGRPSKS